MSDLIKRQDAMDEIRKSIIPHDMACACYSDLFINAVRRVPSADRPQGEWIRLSDGVGLHKECGYIGHMDDAYCGRCGCRMKGIDDE